MESIRRTLDGGSMKKKARSIEEIGSVDDRQFMVGDLFERLLSHHLYQHICDERSLRLFMRAHVFAVWDFQSLIKALQRMLTCVDIPWLPSSDPVARRLINEIVLDEESDQTPEGKYLSHFELYLEAMAQCGADATPAQNLICDLRAGKTLEESLEQPSIPPGVRQFVLSTMAVAQSRDIHRIAAAFAYGREEVIPAMFRRLVDELEVVSPECWSTFRFYLDRHISEDADRHGPFARELVARICGSDNVLWSEAQETARSLLEARIALWDEVLKSIISKR